MNWIHTYTHRRNPNSDDKQKSWLQWLTCGTNLKLLAFGFYAIFALIINTVFFTVERDEKERGENEAICGWKLRMVFSLLFHQKQITVSAKINLGWIDLKNSAVIFEWIISDKV